jgi:hypothetical protein
MVSLPNHHVMVSLSNHNVMVSLSNHVMVSLSNHHPERVEGQINYDFFKKST